jgi:hypothetical protein
MKPEYNMKSIQNHPMPGASLTADKEQKLPFNQQPKFVDRKQAMEEIWNGITSKESLPQLLGMMRQDIPLGDIAKVLVKMGTGYGKWNVDMGLMLIQPTVLMLMEVAHRAGVDYVFSKDMPNLDAEINGEKEEFLKKQMNEEVDPSLMAPETTRLSDELALPEEGMMSPPVNEPENLEGLM